MALSRSYHLDSENYSLLRFTSMSFGMQSLREWSLVTKEDLDICYSDPAINGAAQYRRVLVCLLNLELYPQREKLLEELTIEMPPSRHFSNQCEPTRPKPRVG